MHPAEVCQFCVLDETGLGLMCTAMNQLQMAARVYHRVLKLARTIADLAGSKVILWEIIYSMEGAQIFCTRNFLHHSPSLGGSTFSLKNHLDELVQQGEERFVNGYMLPKTGLALKPKNYCLFS